MTLVKDFVSMPTYSSSLMRPKRQEGHASFGQEDKDDDTSTPVFDVLEDKQGMVHLVMDVPGVSARDLNIELENDHVLRVSGTRTRYKNGYTSRTEFAQSIRLKDTVDVKNLNVNLSSGVLTITAPQKRTKIKKLPISCDDPPDILDRVRNRHEGEQDEG